MERDFCYFQEGMLILLMCSIASFTPQRNMIDWSTPHNLLPKTGIQDSSSNPSPAVTEAALWLVPPQKQNDKELRLDFVDIRTQAAWGSLSHGDTVFWEWCQGQTL